MASGPNLNNATVTTYTDKSFLTGSREAIKDNQRYLVHEHDMHETIRTRASKGLLGFGGLGLLGSLTLTAAAMLTGSGSLKGRNFRDTFKGYGINKNIAETKTLVNYEKNQFLGGGELDKLEEALAKKRVQITQAEAKGYLDKMEGNNSKFQKQNDTNYTTNKVLLAGLIAAGVIAGVGGVGLVIGYMGYGLLVSAGLTAISLSKMDAAYHRKQVGEHKFNEFKQNIDFQRKEVDEPGFDPMEPFKKNYFEMTQPQYKSILPDSVNDIFVKAQKGINKIQDKIGVK